MPPRRLFAPVVAAPPPPLPASLLTHLDQGQQMLLSSQLEAFLKSFQAQSSTTGPNSGAGPVETLLRRFGLST